MQINPLTPKCTGASGRFAFKSDWQTDKQIVYCVDPLPLRVWCHAFVFLLSQGEAKMATADLSIQLPPLRPERRV